MSKKQFIEKIIIFVLPIIVGSLIMIGIYNNYRIADFQIDEANCKSTVNNMMGIYATLLGFSITAESILVTFQGGEFSNLIIKAGHLKTVLFSFMLTNISLFIGLVWFIYESINGVWSFARYFILIILLIIPLSYLAISILYFFVMLSSSRK